MRARKRIKSWVLYAKEQTLNDVLKLDAFDEYANEQNIMSDDSWSWTQSLTRKLHQELNISI